MEYSDDHFAPNELWTIATADGGHHDYRISSSIANMEEIINQIRIE
ncbi:MULTISPECIES: hypothetical protein [unclassified Nocardiopsis]|nr:hypothetical protein [Nocardiopsis sp. TSRI0078]